MVLIFNASEPLRALFEMNSLSTCCSTVLPVPRQLSISANLPAQQLSISWVGGAATTFDLTIVRTELDETVFFVRTFLFLFCLFCSSWQFHYKLKFVSHIAESTKKTTLTSTSKMWCVLWCLLVRVPRLSVCGWVVSLWSVLCICLPFFFFPPRRQYLCHQVQSVGASSGTGPRPNHWSAPRCRSKSAQETASRPANGATLWYTRVRRATVATIISGFLLVPNYVFSTLLLLSPLQEMTCPPTWRPRPTPRTKWCLSGITPRSAALWKRKSALAPCSLATQHCPRSWSAGGPTQLQWSTSSRQAGQEPTSSVWTTRSFWWAELWSLLDVR